MSFFSALYRLLIGPLELFFEILFSMANHIINNPGISIVFLSIAMNFLVLPLYKRADAMQEEERQTNERLKHWTAHIKKTFKGDERFMILQTYYRQNHYKPTDALKGSVSLLLEIPFFMAAYNFLSGLPILHGASFGPIQNLGAPDAMLVLGGVAINVLPILMTVINLVSSAIYTKGMSTRSKVQLYVMAGLFLVLLYDSPAGLVFYWTLNNVFSLVKNVFYKLKNPQKVFCALSSAVGAVAFAYILIHPMNRAKTQIIIGALILMLQLPLIVCLLRKKLPHNTEPLVLTKKQHAVFWSGAIFLTVLTGVMIPTTVIHASPEEFIDAVTYSSPLLYILNSALIASGFFLVWFGIFYLLASNTGKKWMGYGMCALSAIATADFMLFNSEYGNMTPDLQFDAPPVYDHVLLNFLTIAVLALLVFVLWKYQQNFLRSFVLLAATAAMLLSTANMVQIHTTAKAKMEQMGRPADVMPVIPLSKTGQNVMVLMMDRAINSYFPYLLAEKPELQEQFAGFTYYPNTISFGGYTNFGSPSLFGGYEYTPDELNKRNTESLQSKQIEALKVMPALFHDAGYQVTVCDPPYAGYDWIPDLSIYDEIPGVQAYNTMQIFEAKFERESHNSVKRQNQNRNFFCYSLFKIAPVICRDYIYDNGRYNSYGTTMVQTIENISEATGVPNAFMHKFAVLQNLIPMTQLTDDSGSFLMLTNDTTHDPALLQEPAYEPSDLVDNLAYDAAHAERVSIYGETMQLETEYQMIHFHANMAAFLELGKWFDYLRENEVYDNTRIIIVSDHGRDLGHLGHLALPDGEQDDMMMYHPILLVKDFNSQEFAVNSDFMTNADTPTLALEGLVENPVNPYTDQAINNLPKQSGPQKIFLSHLWDVKQNNGNTFQPDHWYTVHDDIFDPNNWEYLDKH